MNPSYCDGVVNRDDLTLLSRNWQGDLADVLLAAGLEGVSIPEPSSVALGLGLLLIPRRRQRAGT